MITKLMTKTEYAKHRGVKPPYISQLIKQGKIKLDGDKIDPEKSDAALGPPKAQSSSIEINQPKSEEPKPQSSSILQEIPIAEALEISASKIISAKTFFEAQQYKEVYSALTKKVEYEKAIGLLMTRAEHDEINFNTARGIRDFLTSIPNRLAPLIAPETDLHICNQILKTEINALLEEVSSAFA